LGLRVTASTDQSLTRLYIPRFIHIFVRRVINHDCLCFGFLLYEAIHTFPLATQIKRQKLTLQLTFSSSTFYSSKSPLRN